MRPAPSLAVQGGPRALSGDPGDGLVADAAWLELAVTCDAEAVEAVSEIFARVAPGGVSVEPAFTLADEGLGATIDPSRPATVRAFVPARDTATAERATATVTTALGHLQAFGLGQIGDLATSVVHESDWATAWQRHVGVLRVGQRIVIRPTWRRHRRSPGEVVIAMDPGMAFGTGLHPTTRLCLATIERWAAEGRLERAGGAEGRVRFLDVGCGSGILAVAAGLLGAGEIGALDTDPIAIEATVANARRNGLGARIATREGTLPSTRGPWDLVAANLIASVLIMLAGNLRDELVSGGRLVASGIFIDREDAVRAAFTDVGLDVVGRVAEGDWVALDVERPVGQPSVVPGDLEEQRRTRR